jgi:hypothetical protein
MSDGTIAQFSPIDSFYFSDFFFLTCGNEYFSPKRESMKLEDAPVSSRAWVFIVAVLVLRLTGKTRCSSTLLTLDNNFKSTILSTSGSSPCSRPRFTAGKSLFPPPHLEFRQP